MPGIVSYKDKWYSYTRGDKDIKDVIFIIFHTGEIPSNDIQEKLRKDTWKNYLIKK